MSCQGAVRSAVTHVRNEETMAATMTNVDNTTAIEVALRKPSIWGNLGFQVALSMALGIVVGLVWSDFAASLKILGGHLPAPDQDGRGARCLPHRRGRHHRCQ
jgi:hypothetical protein